MSFRKQIPAPVCPTRQWPSGLKCWLSAYSNLVAISSIPGSDNKIICIHSMKKGKVMLEE